MSNQQILATYIDGVFRPVDPESVELTDGQHVMIEVKPIDNATYILALAKQVYVGLSEEEIAEIEKNFRRQSWGSDDIWWQEFSLTSALRDMDEADEVTYTLDDLQEKF
jgi:predicted DNA-binding antitoxin AbrB/MazE fold protein